MKKSIYIFLAIIIIFLTGCARTGYHTPLTGMPPALPPPSFAWPLKGDMISRFGAPAEGDALKGILLAARPYTPVLAASEGRVVFVDPSLPGYGHAVILEHGEGFYTVYARYAEPLVKLGDWVKKGEPIARMGPSGKLYFEIRRNVHAGDPLSFLPARQFGV